MAPEGALPETPENLTWARKRFFAVFGKRWPEAKGNDPLRYALLSRLLRKNITGTGHWTATKYNVAADRIEELSDAFARDLLFAATPDALARVTAEAKQLRRDNRKLAKPVLRRTRNVARLTEIEEGLRECGGFRKREHGVAADLLREVYDLAVEAGDEPLAAVAEMLRAADADITLAKAERWIEVSRLASADTRALFPSLTWTHFETACFFGRIDDEPIAPSEVLERLKTAADNGLTCAGFYAWLKRNGPPSPDEPTPAEDVSRRLCLGLPEPYQQTIQERLVEIFARYTLRPRSLPQ